MVLLNSDRIEGVIRTRSQRKGGESGRGSLTYQYQTVEVFPTIGYLLIHDSLNRSICVFSTLDSCTPVRAIVFQDITNELRPALFQHAECELFLMVI